jgi:flagellar hook-basal body complex protein FliE
MSDPLGLIGNSGGVPDPRSNQAAGADPQAPTDGPSFKDTLLQNIERVNELQRDAEQAIEDLSAGRRDDMANVMIAKQKADMAFKMLLQVRNKMMDAYDEVKRLRV